MKQPAISERQRLVDKIFTRALELAGDERSAYIHDNCTEDEMRCEVLALVESSTSSSIDEQFDAIRDRLWGEVIGVNDGPDADLTGQRLDQWRIGKRLARGGLATVYLATRDDGEFEQIAAFKVLRRGLDTDDIVARFRAERQMLSTLDHPAIASILDGGALPDGRPYLVLEYVDGDPITAYCEKHNVDVRGRVNLVIDVLRALHHAHKHTIVHRDIKPSNILVSTEGNVSLLDFGIAKLLDPEAIPGSSTLTRTGVSLLTPGYGSPEQRDGQAITTVSDIYQVGVLLYELLACKRPSLSDPEVPSRVLKGTKTYTLVRGDLDAIVMKAMRVEPAERYGSAGELVADLERYLDNRPVIARRDSPVYRLKKLAKRRPLLIPLLAIVLLGISAYVITLTLYSKQLLQEQQRAEAATALVIDLFDSSDPFSPADPDKGSNITVVEALELGRARVQVELKDQPALRAELLGTIANVYRNLDQNGAAIELGEQALALNLELHGEYSEPVLENLRLLAYCSDAIGDVDRAGEFYTRQLEAAREIYAGDDPELGVAEVASGNFIKSQGDIGSGLELLYSGIDKLRAAPDAYAETMINAILSSAEQDGTNDASESMRLLEEGLALAESSLGPDSLYAAQLRVSIGRNALFLHDYERSTENYLAGLRILETQLGRGHGATITALQDYGASMNVSGDHAGAEAVYRELVDRLVSQYGENHRSVADNYQNLATTLTRQAKYGESLPLHRKAYEIYKLLLDDDHYIIAFPLLSITFAELESGNAKDAEAAGREALGRIQAALPDSYAEGVARCLVGIALEQQGNLAEGSAMVEASHALILKRDVLVPTYKKLCRVP